MLFHWLASMPAAKARELYVQLLREHPLLYNVQDGRGLTLLMHAAANGNPTIVNIIVGACGGGGEGWDVLVIMCKKGSHPTPSVQHLQIRGGTGTVSVSFTCPVRKGVLC